MKSIESKTEETTANKESIFEKISFFLMYGRGINSKVPIYSPLVYGRIKHQHYQNRI